MLDYETFVNSLENLEAWIVAAGEVLNGQDPNRSSDLSIIQERMEELKVSNSFMTPELSNRIRIGY